LWAPIDLHSYFPGSAFRMLACCTAGYTAYVGFFLMVRGTKQAGPPAARPPAERSEAGGERGCTPLLTAKYEPDITLGGVLQAKLQPASS